MRKWLSLTLVLLMLLSLAGCGKAESTADRGEPMATYAANDTEMEYGVTADSTSEKPSTLPENRKLIRTIQMDVETEDLDALLAAIDEKIAQLSGYVESREVYNGSSYASYRYRNANLTVRIPAQQLDAFTAHVGGVSNVVSSREEIDDITLTYVATDSRMKALKAEEERLLELMEQADNMSDLLEIEARLTDVRYELERVASQLRTFDNQVDYATVHLDINEVREYTVVEEQTVWQRIATGFVDSLKDVGDGIVNFLVWLIVNLPHLIIWGAVITGCVFLIRFLAKKRGKKHPKKTPPAVPPTEEQNL